MVTDLQCSGFFSPAATSETERLATLLVAPDIYLILDGLKHPPTRRWRYQVAVERNGRRVWESSIIVRKRFAAEEFSMLTRALLKCQGRKINVDGILVLRKLIKKESEKPCQKRQPGRTRTTRTAP